MRKSPLWSRRSNDESVGGATMALRRASRSAVRTLCSLVLAGCLVALAGCASGDDTGFAAAGPYAQDFQAGYEEAESDYVRDILRDGEVSAFEYRDAQDHVVSCLEAAGWEASYVVDEYGDSFLRTMMRGPGETVTDADRDRLKQAVGQCSEQWIYPADNLFEAVRVNPDNQDWDELVAACLVRRGVVEEGFTVEDYKDLQAEYWAGEPSGPMVLPGGKTMRDPDADHCARAPLQ